MLNNDSLAQLQQLKADIRQQERSFDGLVSGSQNTFGFVRADQGPQHFLPPPEMQRVFPGDRIRFQLKTDDQGREYAAVQKLISSELKQFCGKCMQHGKAWFVDMDVPGLNRKLFLPPDQRRGVQAGDWLQCQVSRHPVREGKGQARVLQNLGPDSAADFPSRYAAVNYQLEANESSEPELHAAIDLAMQQRPERTDLPLASIDPAAARDIDDALCARVLDQGWEVIVAIADPASVLALDTDTGQAAQRRAATAYLPHRQLPMLPPHIAENTCSLLGNQLRLAMLCTLQIAATGEVIDASFAQATIRSRAQLSYAELERCFEQQSFDAIDPATRDSLQALRQVSERMRHWRGATQLLIDDKPEYRMCLNAAGRIEGFSVSTKGVAQRIVEECMVATNQAAARKLSDHGGLFSSHAGFRTDKLADADSLLRAAGWDKLNDAQELTQLQHYRAALAYLGGQPQYHHQRNILSRFLQRATVSSSAKPHFGMGVASYLTFTSPLRRYVDFFNHQQMQRLLQGEPPLAMEAIQLQQLEARLARIRQAIHWSEQWLKCEYLERHRGTPEQGHVVQANPFGLVVRLDDSGIEGILEKRHLPAGMKFNAAKLRFGKDGSTIGLDDAVTVGVSSIKRDKRQILFKLLNA